MFSSPSNHKRSTVSLAGWLFADLMLGLWAVFMVAGLPPKQDPPTPTPTLTATATMTATSTPRPAQSAMTPMLTFTPLPTDTGPVGLSKAQCYNLELSEAKSAGLSEKDAILYQLRGQLPNDPDIRAGLMLIWGHGRDIYDGRQLAMRVGSAISETFPLSFGPQTGIKSLGFDYGEFRHVQVEVYFFTDGEWRSGREVKCEFVD